MVETKFESPSKSGERSIILVSQINVAVWLSENPGATNRLKNGVNKKVKSKIDKIEIKKRVSIPPRKDFAFSSLPDNSLRKTGTRLAPAVINKVIVKIKSG